MSLKNEHQQNIEVNHTLAELDSYKSRSKNEQLALFQKALQLCEDTQSYSLLIALLRLNSTTQERFSRADILAVVLNIVDESHALFRDLIKELSEGERLLVLGILIEASRLEPDKERRLLRLKHITSVIPKGSRSLYWSEAAALSQDGGDDAQLALLGFVRQLPETAQATTYERLKEAIRQVNNPYKKAMAFASLSELVALDQSDFQEAEYSAARIPNPILRTITTTRLSELKHQASE